MRKEGYEVDEPPEVGQYVSLPKCVPDVQPCPRIELSLLNYSASALCMLSLSSGGWPNLIAPMVWDAHSAHLSPAEKQRLTAKITAALSSPTVLEFFRRRTREQNG